MSLPVICILNVLCTVLLVYRHTGTYMHVHTFCALLYNVKYVMLCMNAITWDGCAYVRMCVCRFIQSFNRPNLKYYVRVKRPKGIVQDLGDLISLRYKDQCGIVYCLSRSVYLAGDLHTQ